MCHLIRSCLVAALLGLLGGRAAFAADENGFVRGNGLFAAGKYPEAAAAYEEQVHHGDDSANLFYNLGNAYYRAGQRGRAILNYQRALQLEASHAEAAANLAFIGGNRASAAADNSLPVGTNTLSWLTASAGWLAVAGAVIVIFLRRRRTLGWMLAATGSMLGMAGVAALWWTAGKTHATSRALVLADGVPALYSPADNSKVITTLTAGTEIRVLSAQGAWSYALLGDGSRAWVASGKIERLIPSR